MTDLEKYKELLQAETEAWNEWNGFLDTIFPKDVPGMTTRRFEIEERLLKRQRAENEIDRLACRSKEVAILRTRAVLEASNVPEEDIKAALARIESEFARYGAPDPEPETKPVPQGWH